MKFFEVWHETKFEHRFKTYNEAWEYILGHQANSVSHAMTHERWTIKEREVA